MAKKNLQPIFLENTIMANYNFGAIMEKERSCKRCGKIRKITSFPMNKHYADGRTKTCRPCYKNNHLKEPYKWTDEQREHFRKKMIGEKRSLEWRLNISKGQHRAVREGRHHWKINKKPHPDAPRTWIEYKLWREKVLKRANYKCEICESSYRLHAHHIKCYYSFPELRTDIMNGQALCQSCHNRITWKERRGKNEKKCD